MERSLISLSALTLSLIFNPAVAQDLAAINQNEIGNNEITPFNLVRRGYQGSFSERGIPSNGAFVAAVQFRKITAKDLVEKAIASGRLAPETINNSNYLNQVRSHLTTLQRR
ncbi:hypothetical protein [Myxosarcina sp. GI1]|uniref:hypothetical protein n=1 Tax=Myxosarcina sp. GI1 TaxID=1541065 RepID=UPI0005624085|nr:hypothetical protein [Myxosarcina sp. GI1]